jgi:hypothetical protein
MKALNTTLVLAVAMTFGCGSSSNPSSDGSAGQSNAANETNMGSYFMCDSISETILTRDGVDTVTNVDHTCMETKLNYTYDLSGFLADCARENTSGKGLGGSTTLHCVAPDLGSKCVTHSGTPQYSDTVTIYIYCDTPDCVQIAAKVESSACQFYGLDDAGAAGSGG